MQKVKQEDGLAAGLLKKIEDIHSETAKDWFQKLIQKVQYVGEVYSSGYETFLVQIHDHYRKQVGGIPSLSFLIATRINPEEGQQYDYRLEDTSIVLLRVMDATPSPHDVEAERIRFEKSQEVGGETDKHWDESGVMDLQTHNVLSFAAVNCRVIGTFFLDHNPHDPNQPLILRFGSDISNYYPNRGLKVYKPNAESLKEIVNYQPPSRRTDLRNHSRVSIGEVRYASTNRSFQGISNVEVSISPADLLEQKTALFGMTRTGKSNTTKIIAKSVFDLRFDTTEPLRIGQIIFDPNGEYANENIQDKTALKNVGKIHSQGQREEVITYGVIKHPNDPERKLMLLNFFEESNLQIGKDIIDSALAEDPAKFIQNFCQVRFELPESNDQSALTRYHRRVLAYRALLVKAGFPIPTRIRPNTKGLFSTELLNGRPNARQGSPFNGMSNALSEPDNAQRFSEAATIFTSDNPSWNALAGAFESLFEFMKTSEYKNFEHWYINDRPKASGNSWADEDFKKILQMFSQPNGARQIGKVRELHTPNTQSDYAQDIYEHLRAGKMVIIDQSSGEPEVNDSSARRILWQIFRDNQRLFRKGETPPDILVYVEEAHNLLPSGSDLDLKDVWVRTAKEGAKYRIGMVYVTQEVSSIQKNILKNTANWFIGHLNNTDETKELRKFYDFADFEQSIIRAQDRGFLRIKTLSNPFVIPVQIRKFEV